MPKKRTFQELKKLQTEMRRLEKNNRRVNAQVATKRAEVMSYAGHLITQSGLLSKIRWKVRVVEHSSPARSFALVAQKHQPNTAALAQMRRLLRVTYTAYMPMSESDGRHPEDNIRVYDRRDIEITFPNDIEKALRFIKKYKLTIQVNALKQAAEKARKEATSVENFIADLGMAKCIE